MCDSGVPSFHLGAPSGIDRVFGRRHISMENPIGLGPSTGNVKVRNL